MKMEETRYRKTDDKVPLEELKDKAQQMMGKMELILGNYLANNKILKACRSCKSTTIRFIFQIVIFSVNFKIIQMKQLFLLTITFFFLQTDLHKWK